MIGDDAGNGVHGNVAAYGGKDGYELGYLICRMRRLISA